jgi:hypothetical protein
MPAVLAWSAAVLIAGCGSATVGTGGAGELCYGNGSCNTGLTCASKLCVNLTGAGGGTGGASTGGTNGSGGSAGTGAASGASGYGGGGENPTDAGRMADCVVTESTGITVLTAEVFCQNQLQYCANVGNGLPYTTESDCEAAFTANTNRTQKHCESYRLCWGVEGITNTSSDPALHCEYTIGMGPCAADAGM